VIEGADQVDVTFPGGRRYEAKIVGQDARTDVALIKIEPKETLSRCPSATPRSSRPASG